MRGQPLAMVQAGKIASRGSDSQRRGKVWPHRRGRASAVMLEMITGVTTGQTLRRADGPDGSGAVVVAFDSFGTPAVIASMAGEPAVVAVRDQGHSSVVLKVGPLAWLK